MEQLFIENKFDPQDDLKPLADLLAIPLDREVKNKNESKVSFNFQYIQCMIKQLIISCSTKGSSSSKKKKTDHTILKVTS